MTDPRSLILCSMFYILHPSSFSSLCASRLDPDPQPPATNPQCYVLFNFIPHNSSFILTNILLDWRNCHQDLIFFAPNDHIGIERRIEIGGQAVVLVALGAFEFAQFKVARL